MLVVAAVSAALVMLAALTAERYIGPTAAGWLTALPIGFTAAMILVEHDSGAGVAARVAASAAAHCAAQLLFAVVVAGIVVRRGLGAGFAAGVVAYVGASLVLATLPSFAAVAAAVPALYLAPRLIQLSAAPPPRVRSRTTVAVTCLASSLVVVGAVVVSHAAGPIAGGAVAAFPTMSGALAVAAAVRGPAVRAAAVLLGLVRSLPIYFAFCLIVAATLPTVGLAALPIAAVGGAAVATVVWRTGGGSRPATPGVAVAVATR